MDARKVAVDAFGALDILVQLGGSQSPKVTEKTRFGARRPLAER